MEARSNVEQEVKVNTSQYVRQLLFDLHVDRVFQKLFTDAKFSENQNECMERTSLILHKNLWSTR